MARTHLRNAFTVIDLAVVLATTALLAAIVVPGVARLDRDSGRAMCLANLRHIGAATLVYAAEDPRNQMVPLHRMMVSTLHSEGWKGTTWGWRTAWPISFGGRTAIRPFPTEAGNVTVLMDPNGLWGARTRPLNGYLDAVPQPSDKGLAVFHCPDDTGYPDAGWASGVPPEATNIPCYDFLGNSYRINALGIVWLSGPNSIGSFTSGPGGHTASSIASPLAETVLYCDPLFYALVRARGAPNYPRVFGWHGEFLADNVAYCDGSARMTQVGEIHQFTPAQLAAMGYTQSFPYQWFLARGPSWRMDCYPTPGALIKMWDPTGHCVTPDPGGGGYTGWPFDNHQYNLPP